MWKKWVAKHSLRMRYALVRLIAPKVYKDFNDKILEHKRPMITFVHEHLGNKPLIGVEIGVSHGIHAENILKRLNICKLFLVDPYEPYLGASNEWNEEHAYGFPEAKERLAKFKEETIFIRKKSIDAISLIPNELDFVYIDGNHAYSFVKSDIEYYYPKVKKGGILGGHDFSADFLGVVEAVMEFTDQYKLRLFTAKNDWWIIK